MTDIKKCLLPVAGYGTRFLPVTKTVPKELLPVLSKPLLEYAIEEAIPSGVKEFSLILSDSKQAIKDYLSPKNELIDFLEEKGKLVAVETINKIIDTCKFNFVYQSKMLGLGHAILQGRESIGNEKFAVILPDDLCDSASTPVIEQMINISNKYPDKCIVAIEEVDPLEVNKYGVISGSLLKNEKSVYVVTDMVEKPDINDAPSNLAIIGRYILIPQIFEILDSTKPDFRGEIQITDALKVLAKKKKVLAYSFDGLRLDCGSVEGFIKANNYFFEKIIKKSHSSIS